MSSGVMWQRGSEDQGKTRGGVERRGEGRGQQFLRFSRVRTVASLVLHELAVERTSCSGDILLTLTMIELVKETML